MGCQALKAPKNGPKLIKPEEFKGAITRIPIENQELLNRILAEFLAKHSATATTAASQTTKVGGQSETLKPEIDQKRAEDRTPQDLPETPKDKDRDGDELTANLAKSSQQSVAQQVTPRSASVEELIVHLLWPHSDKTTIDFAPLSRTQTELLQVSQIFRFIKSNNLAAIHSIAVKYPLFSQFSKLRVGSIDEDFRIKVPYMQLIVDSKVASKKGSQVQEGISREDSSANSSEHVWVELNSEDMESLNPLLAAIAMKRVKIVQYLLNDLNFSLKLLGGIPVQLKNALQDKRGPIRGAEELKQENEERGNQKEQDDELEDEDHFFALRIAISHKDKPMLKALWSANFGSCWNAGHLCKLLDLLISEDWLSGLLEVTQSYTFEVILLEMQHSEQLDFIQKQIFEKFTRKGTKSQRLLNQLLQKMICPSGLTLNFLSVLLQNKQELSNEVLGVRISEFLKSNYHRVTLPSFVAYSFELGTLDKKQSEEKKKQLLQGLENFSSKSKSIKSFMENFKLLDESVANIPDFDDTKFLYSQIEEAVEDPINFLQKLTQFLEKDPHTQTLHFQHTIQLLDPRFIRVSICTQFQDQTPIKVSLSSLVFLLNKDPETGKSLSDQTKISFLKSLMFSRYTCNVGEQIRLLQQAFFGQQIDSQASETVRMQRVENEDSKDADEDDRVQQIEIEEQKADLQLRDQNKPKNVDPKCYEQGPILLCVPESTVSHFCQSPLILAVTESDGSGDLLEYLLSNTFFEIWNDEEIAGLHLWLFQENCQEKYLQIFLQSHVVHNWYNTLDCQKQMDLVKSLLLMSQENELDLLVDEILPKRPYVTATLLHILERKFFEYEGHGGDENQFSLIKACYKEGEILSGDVDVMTLSDRRSNLAYTILQTFVTQVSQLEMTAKQEKTNVNEDLRFTIGCQIIDKLRHSLSITDIMASIGKEKIVEEARPLSVKAEEAKEGSQIAHKQEQVQAEISPIKELEEVGIADVDIVEEQSSLQEMESQLISAQIATLAMQTHAFKGLSKTTAFNPSAFFQAFNDRDSDKMIQILKDSKLQDIQALRGQVATLQGHFVELKSAHQERFMSETTYSKERFCILQVGIMLSDSDSDSKNALKFCKYLIEEHPMQKRSGKLMINEKGCDPRLITLKNAVTESTGENLYASMTHFSLALWITKCDELFFYLWNRPSALQILCAEPTLLLQVVDCVMWRASQLNRPEVVFKFLESEQTQLAWRLMESQEVKEHFIKIVKKKDLFDSQVLDEINALQNRFYPSRIKYLWPDEELQFILNSISEDDAEELEGCLGVLHDLPNLELASKIAGFVRIRKTDVDSEEMGVFQYIYHQFEESGIYFKAMRDDETRLFLSEMNLLIVAALGQRVRCFRHLCDTLGPNVFLQEEQHVTISLGTKDFMFKNILFPILALKKGHESFMNLETLLKNRNLIIHNGDLDSLICLLLQLIRLMAENGEEGCYELACQKLSSILDSHSGEFYLLSMDNPTRTEKITQILRCILQVERHQAQSCVARVRLEKPTNKHLLKTLDLITSVRTYAKHTLLSLLQEQDDDLCGQLMTLLPLSTVSMMLKNMLTHLTSEEFSLIEYYGFKEGGGIVDDQLELSVAVQKSQQIALKPPKDEDRENYALFQKILARFENERQKLHLG